METHIWNRIHPMIVECATALLGSYGVEVRSSREVEQTHVDDAGIAAFIGFVGQDIRGTLVISAPESLYLRANPLPNDVASLSLEDQRDWAGELANQFLGRLKLKLLGYGVSFSLSAPTTLVGRDLRGGASKDQHPRYVLFDAGGIDVFVQFDAEVSPNLQLVEVPTIDHGPSMVEGDLMLF